MMLTRTDVDCFAIGASAQTPAVQTQMRAGANGKHGRDGVSFDGSNVPGVGVRDFS